MKEYNIKNIVKKLLNKNGNFITDTAIVVGSGVDILSNISNPKVVTYKELNMPVGQVSGHSGQFTFGYIADKKVVIASRYHYFEEGDTKLVALPYQILAEYGIKKIIIQSSCAGLNKNYDVGDVINITDHINFSGNNPLIGLKPIKFVNMSNSYDDKLIKIVKQAYKENDLEYKSGTHIQFSGTNYETRAELNMCKLLNVDTVSMSLVYDNLLSNYYNFKVCAFGIITNVINEDAIKSLNHIEVLNNAKKGNNNFIKLIRYILTKIDNE